MRQVWFNGDQLPVSLAIKSGSQKRKKVDDCENMISKNKEHQNHAKRRYRIRKTAIRMNKKAVFILLARMMILRHIHMEIKPTVRMMIVSIFHFF